MISLSSKELQNYLKVFLFYDGDYWHWQDIPLFQISWANENSTFFVFNTVVFKFYVFSFRTYRVWKTWILKRKFCNDLYHVCLLFVKTQLRCNLFHWEVFSFTKSNFRLNEEMTHWKPCIISCNTCQMCIYV